jgi:hypothetical protein
MTLLVELEINETPGTWWHANYAHFLIQKMARLFMELKKLGKLGDPDVHVKCCHKWSYIVQVLTPNPIVHAGHADVIIRNEDALPMILGFAPGPHVSRNDALVPMATYLSSLVPKVEATFFTLIQRNGPRRLKSEILSCEKLRPFRFREVYFDDMPFIDQIRTMKESKFVVAPHGAACANVLFMQPGARFLEITPWSFEQPLYGDMCKMCGIEHISLESIPPRGMDPNRRDEIVGRTREPRSDDAWAEHMRFRDVREMGSGHGSFIIRYRGASVGVVL